MNSQTNTQTEAALSQIEHHCAATGVTTVYAVNSDGTLRIVGVNNGNRIH